MQLDRKRVQGLLLAAAKERAAKALTLASDEPKQTKLFAPFSPSPDAMIDAVWTYLKESDLELQQDELLVDLGCGDGRWLVTGVRSFGCRALGIELDPALVRIASDKVFDAQLTDRITIVEGDIMKMPIRDARLVIVYAFAESLSGIREYLTEQLSDRAVVLSVGFRVPEWKPRWTDRVVGLRWYLYEMKSVTTPQLHPSASQSI